MVWWSWLRREDRHSVLLAPDLGGPSSESDFTNTSDLLDDGGEGHDNAGATYELAPGGRVLDSVDLTDVYMLFYLPEAEAGKVTIGAEARLLFDALPDAVIPASVYYVAPEAQFTPKTVETRAERQKLAFQVRARIDSELLKKYEPYVKIGLPGVVYVRLDPAAQWPERLQVRLPELPETKP
jgi:hypothetical protein